MASVSKRTLPSGQKSAGFYVFYREHGSLKREKCVTPDGDLITNKAAAQQYLSEWMQARVNGAMGLIDPFKASLDTPIGVHLDAYLVATAGKGTSAFHLAELNRVLTLTFAAASVKRLRDLTPNRLKAYLDSRLSTRSATTLNRCRQYLVSFVNWMVADGRLKVNPINSKTLPRYQPNKAPRRRAAYTPAQLRSLVQAALTYPVAAQSINRGGRPRADGTRPASSPATLSLETVATLSRLGDERALMYRVLIATGLRRGELSRVQVGHLEGGKLAVPGHLLKVKTVQYVVFLLPPTLASDLSDHVADRNPNDSLLTVPEPSNLSGLHQRHLRHAGLPATDGHGRHYDVHAIRRTVALFLDKRGVSETKRKRYLRHKASGVTQIHYGDLGHERPTCSGKVFALLSKLDAYLVSQPPTA